MGMKTMKKIASLLLVCVMVLGLSVTAFALDSGKGGPATITIENAAVDHTYTFYQLFDATVSADGTKIAYKVPAGKTLGSPATDWFAVDAAGNVTAKPALTETVLRSDAFKTWATGFGINQYSRTVALADLTDKMLVVENLPYGYYLITTTLGKTVVTVDSTMPNAKVHDKNDGPGWDNGPGEPGKVIVESDGTKVSHNTAKLEEEITFDIGVTSKNYDGDQKIFKYEIEDKMHAGMTFLTNLTVKVGTVTITPAIKWYTDDNFTQEVTGTEPWKRAKNFKVTIPWTSTGTSAGDSLYPNGEEIHITYKAKLDASKLTDTDTTNDVLFNAPNENKSVFKWYAGPGTGTDPTDPKGTAPEKKTETYATEIEVLKTDGTSALSGAEFTLTGPTGTLVFTQGVRYVADNAGAYWKLKDGTYTTTAPTAQGINQNAYESTTQRYRQETFTEVQGAGQTNATMKAFVGADGKVKFSGLVPGAYTLTESVVPAGYNKAADVEFTVSFADADKTWSVTSPVTAVSGKTLTVTVVNNQGTELPGTGGIGTTIFYVVGAILLVGAGVVLVSRRRMQMNAENE
ncbi:MAG: isopeptide-forming domain-containing fimbrial protein [Lachnospiraceae bacterium]|nr:isopeptide-forming domain-containing fimbrial protein [Lachnospiraceae bacterium]